MRRRSFVIGLLVLVAGIVVWILVGSDMHRQGPDPSEGATREGAPDAGSAATPIGRPTEERDSPESASPSLPLVDEEPPAPDTEPEQAETLSITVRVVDEHGNPIEGVGICEQLGVHPPSPGPYTRHLGRTDHTGRTSFRVRRRSMLLSIEANDDWHSDERHVLPQDGGILTFRVVAKTTVRGTVLDASGAPVEGARVAARFRVRAGPGTSSMMFQGFGPTDADGHFTAPIPAYAVGVRFDVRVAGASASVRINPNEQRDVVLQFRVSVRIAGEIVLQDGQPVIRSRNEAPRIEALPVAGGPVVGGGIQERTNRFFVDVPAPGPYLILLVFDAADAADLTVPDPVEVEAPAQGIRIVCGKGQRLVGQIEGDDVEGFQVGWIRHRGKDPRLRVRRRTRVDAAGRFVLEGLTEGDTVLYVSRPGDDRYGLVERVRLPDENLEVTLQQGQVLEGCVAGYTGRHGFDLCLVLRWRGPRLLAQVEEDGSFVVTGLPPGTYGLGWYRAGQERSLDQRVEPGGPQIQIRLPPEALSAGTAAPK